eukprot:365011-Chlamydomonas_euryale.AAC.22
MLAAQSARRRSDQELTLSLLFRCAAYALINCVQKPGQISQQWRGGVDAAEPPSQLCTRSRRTAPTHGVRRHVLHARGLEFSHNCSAQDNLAEAKESCAVRAWRPSAATGPPNLFHRCGIALLWLAACCGLLDAYVAAPRQSVGRLFSYFQGIFASCLRRQALYLSVVWRSKGATHYLSRLEGETPTCASVRRRPTTLIGSSFQAAVVWGSGDAL